MTSFCMQQQRASLARCTRPAAPRVLGAAPLRSLRTIYCKSAATEALSFEELLASGEASTSGLARPTRPVRPSPRAEEAEAPAAGEPSSSGAAGADGESNMQTAPVVEVLVKPGDTVLGRVVNATPKGAKIKLLDGSGAMGYMPVKEAPYAVRESGDEDVWTKGSRDGGPCVDQGLVREFRVVAIHPDPMNFNQQQPLLSARELDQDLMWQRAQQIMDICVEGKENVRVLIEAANSGGLTSRLCGLNLFVPVSQLEKEGDGKWWSEKSMKKEFVGGEYSVCVVEVTRKSRKVVASLTRARDNDVLRGLEVGCLVSGTVRRVEAFGVFVGVDGCRESGLIHISNISRAHVSHPKNVFQMGDHVKCILMGMDPDYSNISLSTAELEQNEGDIVNNQAAVWENAEEQAELFRQHVQRLKDSGFDFQTYGEAH